MDSVLTTFRARATAYDSETNWIHDRRIIARMLPRGRPGLLLDLCAGTGAVSCFASSKGWFVHALDISHSMLAEIRDPRIVRSVGNAEATAFLNQSFDVVAMRQALHYLDADLAIREMLRLSRGIVSLCQITLWQADHRDIWHKYFSVASPGRKHIFAPGDIREIVSRSGGFVVAECVAKSRERFSGPVAYLGDEIADSLGREFLSAPESFRAAHELSGNCWRSLELTLRWEFLHISA
jgi:SAM-dependent methyltransferase